MAKIRRLLWVDDDGRGRFPYELSVLDDNGFETDWASNAAEAVEMLSATNYELVLLDQVFPVDQKSSYRDVWSGCRLLYWLRGKRPPTNAPQGAMWNELLLKNRPRPKNKNLPVIIISGFQDDSVDQALRQTNHGISIFPKPVDGDELIRTISIVLPRSGS